MRSVSNCVHPAGAATATQPSSWVSPYLCPWPGGAPVTRVELAVDGQWRDARLAPAGEHRYAWRGWTCTWQATAGEHLLQCRAHAADGSVQPLQPDWNTSGLGNNAVQSVQVTVR